MSEITAVKEFIIENFLFGEEEQLLLDTDFFDEGIIDSTGVIELVSFLEERFNISVDDEELIPENLSSLQNINLFLQKKLNKKDA
ncbi:MAG: acyl carrier protein [Ignavibacterium sp.]|jgi:acyl carrier protein|nr:acyl carrier protein [Ignavibacterium sp.]MCO6448589.1 acyl carrier protein [Ignavibacterium album]MDX9713167.1 acyl carrier protein [Ignavibacteriaceae bacterium]GIK23339.1 MAG: acyl carrier protein [Ignavibacteriota bacterium]MDD5608890.1 acyl carrier protein [Ignavibacterium sp.]